MKVAVIVGRFQIPTLHVEHQRLLRTAYEKADKVLVFIGTRIVRSASDPLPFSMTSQVVQSAQSAAVEIHEVKDHKSNEIWIENLKNKVNELTNPEDEIFYYGSRDSFLKVLPEGTNIVEMISEVKISATDVRNSINYENSSVFRAGYIKAVQDEFPAHYAVVDAIITDRTDVLLGKKNTGYCIIGGFADDCDENLEAAAIREVKEETNLDLSNPKYLMSHQCKDWRYTRYRQPFTTVFVFEVENFENYKAGDDIEEIIIVPLTEVENYLLPTDSHLIYINEYIRCQQ